MLFHPHFKERPSDVQMVGFKGLTESALNTSDQEEKLEAERKQLEAPPSAEKNRKPPEPRNSAELPGEAFGNFTQGRSPSQSSGEG